MQLTVLLLSHRLNRFWWLSREILLSRFTDALNLKVFCMDIAPGTSSTDITNTNSEDGENFTERMLLGRTLKSTNIAVHQQSLS